MTAFWDKRDRAPARHADPDAAMSEYMEEIRRAEVAGATAPAAALNGLGDAYFDKEDVVTAVDYYRQAAEVYAEEGMHDNAIACCRKIRRHRPDDPSVGLMLGRYYLAKGLRADARSELEAFAERARASGDLERAIEALEEVVRLDPGAHGHRETLAESYEKAEREPEAVEAYREAVRGYDADGRDDAAERVRGRLRDLSADAPAPVEELPSGGAASDATPIEAPAEEERREAAPAPRPEELAPADHGVEAEPESGAEEVGEEGGEIEETRVGEVPEEEGTALRAPDVDREIGLGLEIEHTSYVEEEPLSPREGIGEPGERLEDRPPIEIPESRPSHPRAGESEEKPTTYGEMFATAGRLAREGDEEAAAGWLEQAADGLRKDERWAEAVSSYRQLDKLGRADLDDYEAWTECARQTGEPVKVLEALESRTRWHLERGERRAARGTAEEMLLVDPDSEVATGFLDSIGSSTDES